VPAFLLKLVMQIDFIEPWIAVDNERDAFEKELRRELSPQAALSAYTLRAIGRRVDCDDVLFEICGVRAEYVLALIHLTWSSKTERLLWPTTTFFVTAEDFINNKMLLDAQDYNL
jgi:hypothetical protein